VLLGGQPTPLPLANLAVSNVEAAGLIKFEPCSALPLPLQQDMWDKSPLCFTDLERNPCRMKDTISPARGAWRVLTAGFFVTSGKFAAIHGHTDIIAI
jgi:hypothetical protein